MSFDRIGTPQVGVLGGRSRRAGVFRACAFHHHTHLLNQPICLYYSTHEGKRQRQLEKLGFPSRFDEAESP